MTRILDVAYKGWKGGQPVCRSDDRYVAGFERRRLAGEFAAVLAELLPEVAASKDAAGR
jgi:hypothetical protein